MHFYCLYGKNNSFRDFQQEFLFPVTQNYFEKHGVCQIDSLYLLILSEFCEVVSKIHIYTKEEVEKMSIGVISDDTQSCLEESPPAMDVSKSSSVSAPDSSPTIVRI